MSVGCKFCALQNSDSIPENSLIVQALQQVIKTLLKRNRTIKNNDNNSNNLCEKIKDLEVSVKNLETENQKLKNDYLNLTKLNEFDKIKCKNLENNLEKLKGACQRPDLNCSEKTFDKGSNKSDYPFAIDKSEHTTTIKSIILAPDTCFPNSEVLMENDYVDDNHVVDNLDSDLRKDHDFVKPESKLNLKTNKLKSSNNLNLDSKTDLNFDPDETCMSFCKEHNNCDEEEEESILIPASPVISKSSSRKKRHFNGTNTQGSVIANDTISSPSLLPTLSLFNKSTNKNSQYQGWLHIKKPLKQTTINKRSWNKSNNDRTNKGVKLVCPEQSASNKYKQSKSPNQSELEEYLSPNHDAHTSLDELFDRTDGVLGMTTVLNESKLYETKMNIDETMLDNNYTQNSLANESVYDSDKVCVDKFLGNTALQEVVKPEKSFLTSNEKENVICSDSNSSFDIAPKKHNEITHKYQSVVRKREDRAKLDTKTCPQCAAYYSDLPPDVREATMREVCRHRYEYVPPSTPKHFWDIGIPSTSVCLERGYITEEKTLTSKEQQEIKEKSSRRRRRKPYQAKFPTKQI